MLAERACERLKVPQIVRMRHMYEVEQMSLRQIAAATGRSRTTIRYALLNAGVRMRPPHVSPTTYRKISYEEESRTIELYQSGMSTAQVAAEVGVTANAVLHRLRTAGLGARSPEEARAISSLRGRVGAETDDLIVRLYRDERWTLQETARRVGVAVDTARKGLWRRGVPLRSQVDVRRIEAARRRGEDVLTVPLTLRVRATGPVARTPVTWIKEYVPSGPLAKAIADAAAKRNENPIVGERMIADQAGLSPKLLWKWRLSNKGKADYGDRATVTSAELVLDALDLFWWEVFDPGTVPGLFSGERGRDVVAWTKAGFDAVELWGDD